MCASTKTYVAVLFSSTKTYVAVFLLPSQLLEQPWWLVSFVNILRRSNVGEMEGASICSQSNLPEYLGEIRYPIVSGYKYSENILPKIYVPTDVSRDCDSNDLVTKNSQTIE